MLAIFKVSIQTKKNVSMIFSHVAAALVVHEGPDGSQISSPYRRGSQQPYSVDYLKLLFKAQCTWELSCKLPPEGTNMAPWLSYKAYWYWHKTRLINYASPVNSSSDLSIYAQAEYF